MTDELKIEKGVPLSDQRGRPMKWGKFAEMEPGDSVFVPDLNAYRMSGRLAPTKKKYPNRQYTIRTVDGGCRVWRLEDREES